MVFTTPPLIAKVPPRLVNKLLNAELSPTAAVNVVAPVLFTVNDLAAIVGAVLMVPPKLTLPLPAVTDKSSVNTMGAVPKITAPLVVLICPAALM